MRTAAKTILHLERQTQHTTAHVGRVTDQPHPGARRQRDRSRSSITTSRDSATTSISAATSRRRPLRSMISTYSGSVTGGDTANITSDGTGTAGIVSAASVTAAKAGSRSASPTSRPSSTCRRQVTNCQREIHVCASSPQPVATRPCSPSRHATSPRRSTADACRSPPSRAVRSIYCPYFSPYRQAATDPPSPQGGRWRRVTGIRGHGTVCSRGAGLSDEDQLISSWCIIPYAS